MGLISKNVNIKWLNATRKWYESKGYFFTKYDDIFYVLVSDLQGGSDAKVEVKCDGCGKTLSVIFSAYNKCVHSDGSYYCYYCAKNGNKKWVSFAEWGIQEFGDDFLDKHWDYELNDLHKMSSKNYDTTPKYEFEYQWKKDIFKKQYVLDNGFDYLEIPYWTDDNQETWKQLIDDKINEVFDKYNA